MCTTAVRLARGGIVRRKHPLFVNVPTGQLLLCEPKRSKSYRIAVNSPSVSSSDPLNESPVIIY
jgi:hypothetical protein